MIKLKSVHAILVLSVVFMVLGMFRLQAPELDHSDEYADANVLDAGRNFAARGFIAARFLPVFDIGGTAYTHYPPLPEIINGVLQRICPDRLIFFRSIALFFAFLNMLFWFLFVRKISDSDLFGLLAGLFYITNPYFIYGMDSMQQLSYSDCLRSLILLIFVSVPAAGRSKRWWLAGLWVLLFVESLISYEYVVYVALFTAFLGLALKEFRKAITVRDWLILLSASVAGFGLHFLQNAWYFGGMGGAASDLVQRVFYRSLGAALDGPRNFNLWSWFNIVILRNFSLVFMFGLSLLTMAGYSAFLLYKGLAPAYRSRVRRMFKLAALFAFCGVSWYVIFPSHSYAHAFVEFLTRHVVPAAAIGFAAFFYLLFTYIKGKMPQDKVLRLIGAALVLSVCMTGVARSQLPVIAPQFKRVSQFNVFKACLTELKGSSAPDALVAVNYYRYPFIRYYLNRRVQVVFDRQTFESLPQKPDYFVFLLYDNQQARELWDTLSRYYIPKLQCKSEMFPAVIFERKKSE